MPLDYYPLEPGGPRRLGVWWHALQPTAIGFDEQRVCILAYRDLEQGRTFQLADGSRLEVRLATRFLFPEIQLRRNGEPLPDTIPAEQARLIAGLTYLMAALNLLLGLAGLFLDARGLQELGYAGGGSSLVMKLMGPLIHSLLYVVLGYYVSRRSQALRRLALLLLALDGAGWLIALVSLALTGHVGFIASPALRLGLWLFIAMAYLV